MRSLILAAALALGLSSAAQAQQARVVPTCGAQSLRANDSTNLFVDSTGILCSTAGAGGSGGTSSGGSVTSAGTNGTSAQAIQGINGGVPVPVLAAGSGSQEQDVRATNTLNAATANAAVTLPVNGQGTIGFTFTGLTASGATVTFEQSNDSLTTWTGVNEVNSGTGVPSATRNTDGQIRISAQGRTGIRVRVSTPGSGSITVASNISVREGLTTLASPLPPGSNAIGTIGVTSLPALAAGSAQIGTIGNTAFGISGTLPAFAATPTFNVGTTNGLALDATVIARLGTLGQKVAAGSAPVVIASDQSAIPVTGTFFQATQPVSAASLPLPTGAATAANQNSTAAGTSATSAQAVQGVTGGVPQNVANGGTFPVQNTAAVVGGNATAVKTDSSATTQPVSGTVTANLGTIAGAATATNQASEIAALGTPSDAAYAGSGTASQIAALKGAYARLALPRTANVNTDLNFVAVAASTPVNGAVRSLQADYVRINFWAGCSQSATYQLQGSNDAFATTAQIVALGPIAAASATSGFAATAAGVSVSTPQTFSSYRVVIVNGSTAGNCTITSSYAAN